MIEEGHPADEELSAQAQGLRGMVETFRLTTAQSGSGATTLKLVARDADDPSPLPHRASPGG